MKFEEKTKINVLKSELFENMIYFLIKGEEVVYVGQSKKGISRPIHHYDKDFDYFTFISVDKQEKLNELESYYIRKYTPKYNKFLPKIKDEISYTEFFEKYYKGRKEGRYNKVKQIIIENKLYFQFYNGRMRIKKENIEKINALCKIGGKTNGKKLEKF